MDAVAYMGVGVGAGADRGGVGGFGGCVIGAGFGCGWTC